MTTYEMPAIRAKQRPRRPTGEMYVEWSAEDAPSEGDTVILQDGTYSVTGLGVPIRRRGIVQVDVYLKVLPR